MTDTHADTAAEHTEKMRRIKAKRDEMMKSKTKKKGLIMVHTGDGKGKSSSGFGMIMRCIAHKMPCAVVQFIKGNWMTGEKRLLRERFTDECRFFVSGEGFTWETQDRDRDIAAAGASPKSRSWIPTSSLCCWTRSTSRCAMITSILMRWSISC